MSRRPIAALVAVVLAIAAAIAVPDPPAVRGASGLPGLETLPGCIPAVDPNDPGSVDVAIRGHGFEPGTTVDIDGSGAGFDGESQVAVVQVDELGTFQTTVSTPMVAGNTQATFDARTRDADGPRARVIVQAPCPPTLIVSPTCGSPDGGFAIEGDAYAFTPGANVGWAIYIDSQATPLGEALTDAEGHADLAATIPALAVGVYSLVAGEVEPGSNASVASVRAFAVLELPCPEPTVRLEPDCGEPGSPDARYQVVVIVDGFRFGPAVITWDVDGSREEFRIDEVPDTGGPIRVTIDPYRRPEGTVITVEVAQYYPAQIIEGFSQGLLFAALAPWDPQERPPRVARATFRVPCPPPPDPGITLEPDCGTPGLVGDPERRYSIGVVGVDLRPGPVQIVFDAGLAAADVLPPETFEGTVDKDGTLVPLTITPLARPVGEYRVTLLFREQPLAEATFRVPCERPDAVLRPLVPECGALAGGIPEAYSVRVRGRQWYPGAIEVVLDPQGTPEVATGIVGDNGRFDITLVAAGRDRGAYDIVARQRDARTNVLRRALPFTVPCIEPTLEISPRIGPAGYATFVEGRDFPAGAVVTLTWDRGLDADRPRQVTANDRGRFRVGLFILPGDLTGVRTLTAATPEDPNAFPGATADYLVVVGSGQPPGVDPDGGIIDRR